MLRLQSRTPFEGSPARAPRRSPARGGLAAAIIACVALLGSTSDAARAGAADEYDRLTSEVAQSNYSGNFRAALTLANRALEFAEREWGAQSQQAAAAHLTIAIQHQSLGELKPAEEHYRRGLAIQEKLVPAGDPLLASFVAGLGGLLYGQGRYEEAEPFMRQALTLHEALFRRTGNEVSLAVALYLLGSNYTQMSRLDEGHALLQRSLAAFGRIAPQGSLQTAIVLNNLATNRQLAGDAVAASGYQLRALELFQKFSPGNLPGIAKVYNNLAYLAEATGDNAKAAQYFAQALDLMRKAFPNGHPDIASVMANYGALLESLGQRDQSEPMLSEALAMRQQWLPPDHVEIALAHIALADLMIGRGDWKRASAALEAASAIFVTRASRQESGRGASNGTDVGRNSLTFQKLVKVDYRLSPRGSGTGFIAAQRALGSQAAASLAQMATRNATSDPRLAELVRTRQDLVAQWHALDQEVVMALAQPAATPASTTEDIRKKARLIDTHIGELDRELAARFPDYAALANPQPVTIAEVQDDLAPDEALVLFLDTIALDGLPEETFVWVVTKTAQRWVRSDVGATALSREGAVLRCGLDAGAWSIESMQCEHNARGFTAADARDGKPLPFDVDRAYALYESLLGGVADLIEGKQLLIVPSGPLTRLPLHVLVTQPPTREARATLRGVAWLARSNATTVLPAVSSLRALRREAHGSAAPEPFVGFGNPALTGSPGCGEIFVPETCPGDDIAVAGAATTLMRSSRSATAVSARLRDGLADVARLRELCPLPDTAQELKCVARSLGADSRSIVVGAAMTEAAVKSAHLDRYRVIHFATHGILASEMARLSSGTAQPALVMTPPTQATETDDGLLTASEISGLKLDADWVIMSACNTAGSGEQSTEALSGLARAFFYAGARALLVSHWPVNSYAATMLTSHTFAELKADRGLGRAEAFRRAMIALMDDAARPWAAHPTVWSPFVVVGEGGRQR